jgi:hypothetical protein
MLDEVYQKNLYSIENLLECSIKSTKINNKDIKENVVNITLKYLSAK